MTALQKDSFKPFSDPEIQEAVKGFLIRNELGRAVAQTIEELKQKYSAVIHRDAIMKMIAAPAQAVDLEQEPETVAPRPLKA